MAKRLKILMSAYACEPGKGSEPGVGWNWALQMARYHDVTVITRSNNRPTLEQGLAGLPGPHPQFWYYDLPERMLQWKRRGLAISAYYIFWQMGVRWRFRHRLSEFDLIHHITFNSYRWPGFWCFTGRPTVLGPLGGGQVCPWRFLPLFGRRWLPEMVRNINVWASFLNFRHYLVYHGAHQILVANEDTARRIPWLYRSKIRYMLETGYTLQRPPPPRGARKTAHRFLWVGGLEKRKAAGLALRALRHGRAENQQLELTFVGTGPEAGRLRRQAACLGVASAVHWLGRRSHEEVQRLLEEHDALIFTSLRDTSGNVVLEAMAAGLPVIVLSHQGVAEMTTEETALRVPPTTLAQTARALGAAMVRLAASPELCHQLGAAGLRRLQTLYLWEQKGAEMNCIYCRTVSQRGVSAVADPRCA